ncbi:glutamate 5-kinase [Halioxenophilus sp. WMMB6]|uniref:glutamate 5-kinase n=1 Tax=Halioxenophilus sp. WMMB6 TaxID=3073815 RepID=UPI00295E8305|nr:glutamate 5-kinase [Halioxenophilus sp. WMMB6]
MSLRSTLASKQRWVIKIGSALLTDNGRQLDSAAIAGWVGQMAAIAAQGKEVILVSSGAVAAGMSRLGWRQRPTRIHELQAAAAVGQMGLVQTYQELFQTFALHTAQVLLDHDDLSNRERYINARSTLNTLLELGVVPVVNENDTVVTDEIRFGDNDSLAALVANLVDADMLVILTDQDGMYTADPRKDPSAELISETKAGAPELEAMAGDGGALGRGGMITKVRAARLAARSGTHTLVVGGRIEQVLSRLVAGDALGTLFVADQQPQQARKQWLAGQLQNRGSVTLDAGAVAVLQRQGKSLLAVGVKAVAGQFKRGDMVLCLDESGREVARGLINYSAREVAKIKGLPTESIEQVLGYKDEDELIHRDNLVVH